MEWLKHLITGILLIILVSFSSCEVVEGIFKAGMWTMLLIIAAVVGLIIFIANRMRK